MTGFRRDRIARWALFLALAIVVSPVATFAQSSRSVESELFGYEVEWDRGWTFDDESSVFEADGEMISLTNEANLILVQVIIVPLESYGSAADGMDDYLSGIGEDAEEVDASRRGENPWWLGEATDGSGIGVYIEAREDGDAIIAVAVFAELAIIDAAMEQVAEEVTIDGDPSLLTMGGVGGQSTNDDDEPIAGEGGATDDGDYVAWTHPTVRLSFDPEVWGADRDESADDADTGRDTLVLLYADEEIGAAVYIETYDDYDGDALECLETAVEEAVGDNTTRARDDDNDDPIEGEDDDRAWVAYSYRNADGDRLATYVDCRVLPDGEGVVVTTLLTLNADFDDVYPEVLDIVDSIEFVEENGANTGGSTGGDELDGVIGFDGFQVEITYNEDLFESATAVEGGGAVLVTDDGAMFFVSAMENDGSTTPADCVDGVAAIFSGEADDLAIVEDDNGDPVAAVDDQGASALFTFSSEGEDRVMVASCTVTADEEGIVIIVGLGTLDIADTVTGIYLELIDGLVG